MFFQHIARMYVHTQFERYICKYYGQKFFTDPLIMVLDHPVLLASHFKGLFMRFEPDLVFKTVSLY